MSSVYRGSTRTPEQIQRLVGDGLRRRGVCGSVLMAVSGGQDSVCLLHAVTQISTQLGLHPVVAHVDHQLNPSSAEASLAVRRLCQSLGLRCLVRSVDVRGQILAHGESTEMAARRLRHASLEEMRLQSGAEVILLGHTADDQAETVLIRMGRGTGTAGLAAMADVEGNLFRPLLRVWRSETGAYCRSLSLPVVSDPSNDDQRIVRNQIRNVVIPALEERFPAARRHLVELATTARRDRAFLEHAARDALEVITLEGRIQPALWAALPPAIAFHALRIHSAGDTGYPRSIVALEAMADRLSSAAKSGPELPTSLDGTAGLPVLCSEGTPGSVLLRVPGRTVVDSLAFNGTILDRKAIAKARLATTSNWDAYLDAKVGSDFEVRRWHPGDRMTPIGSPGSRKLQNVFVDRRVPRSLRARLPVVTAGDGIVWVPGVAVDVHAHVTDDSMRVVHIGVRTAETASDQEAD